MPQGVPPILAHICTNSLLQTVFSLPFGPEMVDVRITKYYIIIFTLRWYRLVVHEESFAIIVKRSLFLLPRKH
jgi:hypothetical protein